MNKVHARSKRSKQAARKAPKPGTTAVDRRLLAQAKHEERQDAAKVEVAASQLRQLRSLLQHAQHAVVRAPNREVPLRGYGPVAALQAYDTIQEVVQGIDNLLAVAS